MLNKEKHQLISDNETVIIAKTIRGIGKFDLITLGLVALAFFGYWSVRFYSFLPTKGTSAASSNALWGQFLTTLACLVVISVLILLLDRRKARFYTLASFWLLIVLFILGGVYSGYSYTNLIPRTYGLDQSFHIGNYQFDVTEAKFDTPSAPSEDCSKLSDVEESSSGGRIIHIGFGTPRTQCQSRNNILQNGHDQAVNSLIKLKVKNISKIDTPLKKHWFNLNASGKDYFSDSMSNGVYYSLPYGIDIKENDLISGEEREVTIKAPISKDEQYVKLVISIEGKANQCVRIAVNK